MGFVLIDLTSGKMDNTSIAKVSKNAKKRDNTYLVTEKKIIILLSNVEKKLLFYSSVNFPVSLVTELCFKDLNEER